MLAIGVFLGCNGGKEPAIEPFSASAPEAASVNEEPLTSANIRFITREEMETLAERTISLVRSGQWRDLVNSEAATARELAVSRRGVYAGWAVLSKRIDEWTLIPPSLSPDEKVLLVSEIKRIEDRSDERTELGIDTMSIYQVRHESLEQLFPRIGFVSIPRAILPRPDIRDDFATTESTGIVGLDGRDTKVWRFHIAGNMEFGRLLHSHAILLRSQEDAELIWAAFCAVHGQRWHNGQHRQIDDRTWWLNWERSEDEVQGMCDHYYEVMTDSEGRVLQGESKCQQVAVDR